MPNPKRRPTPAARGADPSVAQAERSRPRSVGLALALATAGAVLGAVALGVVLTRPDPGACRVAAWSSLPSVAALPSGWTASASGIYIDSVGTTLNGPAPSASDDTAPAIFVSVGCYGPDAHVGVARSHDASHSSGGADISFPAVGDESFATHDASSGEFTVVFRRAQLVATLAAAGSVSVDDLATAARAVDDAMRVASAGGTPSPGGANASPAPSAAGSPAGSASPSGSESAVSHAAPDLEAQLPTAASGVTLAHTSFAGTDVLGSDAASTALTAALTALGKQPADLRIAEAYDESGVEQWYVDAFELSGVSGSSLSAAVRNGWLGAGASGVKTTTATIGGKHVTRIDRGADVPVDTVYVHGAVVFDISSSDAAVVKAVLAKLP
jgi:hypothetical protein